MLVFLFWMFIILFVLSFVSNIVIPIGHQPKPTDIGGKFIRVLLSLLFFVFSYLIYNTGVIN